MAALLGRQRIPTGLRLWLEEESLRLTLMGWRIKDVLAYVNQRLEEGSPDKVFGADSIRGITLTIGDCRKALKRALLKSSSLSAVEMRQVDSLRCEELFRSLAMRAHAGDAAAAEAAIRVLEMRARINGYAGQLSDEVGREWQCSGRRKVGVRSSANLPRPARPDSEGSRPIVRPLVQGTRVTRLP